MRSMPLVVLLFLLVSLPITAQVRIDLGVSAGIQRFEDESSTLVSPEVQFSRGRLTLGYALDVADLNHGGNLYGSHFALAYRWPMRSSLSILAGGGPSYVRAEKLGGELSWNVYAEAAYRRGRVEWFAKVRQSGFDLSDRTYGDASPEGPAVLGGVRFAVNP